MAKKDQKLFGDITAELFGRAQGKPAPTAAPAQQEEPKPVIIEQSTEIPPAFSPVVAEQPAPLPTVQPPVASADTSILQGKLARQAKKEKKNYNYGTKHTFPIPDELWNDAMLLIQAKGLSQVDFIQELIRCAVEENRGAINAVKQMRGTL